MNSPTKYPQKNSRTDISVLVLKLFERFCFIGIRCAIDCFVRFLGKEVIAAHRWICSGKSFVRAEHTNVPFSAVFVHHVTLPYRE